MHMRNSFGSCEILSLRIQPPLHAPTCLLRSEGGETAVFAGYEILSPMNTYTSIFCLFDGLSAHFHNIFFLIVEVSIL